MGQINGWTCRCESTIFKCWTRSLYKYVTESLRHTFDGFVLHPRCLVVSTLFVFVLVTSESELNDFLAIDHGYDKFIIQSLVGNSSWSSMTSSGQFYHTGTIPNKKVQRKHRN